MPRYFYPIMLFLSGFPTTALAVVFNDGQTHIIDYAFSGLERISVTDGPGGDPTTVIVRPSGEITDSVRVSGSSSLRLEGGSLATVVSGSNFANIEIISGIAGTGVSMTGSAQARIRGGIIGGIVSSGPGGRVDILGGNLNVNLRSDGDGTINVFGTEFNFPFGSIVPITGTLTGNLYDGTPLSADFNRELRGIGLINLIEATSSAGDFDIDGIIDGADFLMWQRNGATSSDLTVWEANFGNTPLPVPGDFNDDDIVNGTDFLLWQRNGASQGDLAVWKSNFGGSFASAAVVLIIPEPATSVQLSVLFTMALGQLGFWRKANNSPGHNRCRSCPA